MKRIILLSVMMSLLWGLSAAQEPEAESAAASLPMIVRDPQGIAVLQSAIAAHGGAQAHNNISNLTMTGTIKVFTRTGQQVWNVTRYQARGYRVREELRAGANTILEILNNYGGWLGNNGVVSAMRRERLKYHQDQFNRQFMELIINYNIPQLSIVYLGTVDLGGFTAHRLRLEILPQIQAGILTSPDRVLSEVYIDTRTSLVVKESRLIKMGHGSASLYDETLFLEYTSIGGALFPTHILRKIAGNTVREITYTSITANSTLPPDLFLRPL